MKTNWKTTLGGSLSAFGLALVAMDDPAFKKPGLIIAALGTFFGHLFAQDRSDKPTPPTQ